MSFCINCGTQLADGSKFCINCGAQQPETAQAPVVEATPVVDPFAAQPVMEQAPVVEAAPVFDPFAAQPVVEQPVVEAAPVVDPFAAQPVVEQAPVVEPVPVVDPFAAQPVAPSPVYNPNVQPQAAPVPGQPVMAQPEKPKKKKNLGLILGASIGGAVALITIAIIVIVLILTRKTEVDLSKYLTIEFSGYDTTGHIYDYTFDKEKMLKDIMKDQGKKNVENLKKSDIPEDLYNLINTMYVDVDYGNSGSLKNGDTISVEVLYSEYYLKDAKVKLKNESFDYKVEGLQGLKEYDIFQGIEVTFYGMDGSGYINVEEVSDEEIYYDVYFDYSNSYDLKNGDVVTVTVYTYGNDQYGADLGYKFTSLTKDYTVEGLQKYVDDLSDLSDDNMDDLINIAKDEIADEYDDNYDVEINNIRYIGSYFAKDDSDGGSYLLPIFTATISSDDNEFAPLEIYIPVQLKYLIIDGNGDIITDNVYAYIQGYDYVEGTWTSFDGYSNPYEMYQDQVSYYDYLYQFSSTKELPDFSEEPVIDVPSTDEQPATGDDEEDDSEGGFGMGGDEEDAA